jgi:hypothetical protein
MDSLLYEYNEMMQNLITILIIKEGAGESIVLSTTCGASTLFKRQVSGGACTASIGVGGAFFPLRRGILLLCRSIRSIDSGTYTRLTPTALPCRLRPTGPYRWLLLLPKAKNCSLRHPQLLLLPVATTGCDQWHPPLLAKGLDLRPPFNWHQTFLLACCYSTSDRPFI